MGYNTTYTLTWAATSYWAASPSCVHNPPEGAKYCPQCGTSTARPTVDALVAITIDDKLNEVEHDMSFLKPLRTSGGSRACFDPELARGEYVGEPLPGGLHAADIKWYEYEADLVWLSGVVRDVLFHLEGQGEDSGDIWDAYALNGQVQVHKAEIIRKPVDMAAWRDPE